MAIDEIYVVLLVATQATHLFALGIDQNLLFFFIITAKVATIISVAVNTMPILSHESIVNDLVIIGILLLLNILILLEFRLINKILLQILIV